MTELQSPIPPGLRKITIEPVSRVEGHGKVTITLNDQNQVVQSRLHIVEFRGFEKFVQGRPFWEAPVLVQRLCGICPVSHHLCASKAMDSIVGVDPEDLSPSAEKLRRLMHCGQVFQSDVLHFFHLASPDLLFGTDAPPEKRNIFKVMEAFPELAKKAILMRKFGQEVIAATAGKKIHGTGSIPGGVNHLLDENLGKSFLEGMPLRTGTEKISASLMVQWAQEGLEFFKSYHKKDLSTQNWVDQFAAFPSNSLSLVRKDGAMDLYHGQLRAVDEVGKVIFDQVAPIEYSEVLTEGVKDWTYMKFPYITQLGPEKGWYRVGPLARMNTCDFIPTPLAQKEFEQFKSYSGGKPSGSSLHMHWARLIEVLHSAENMELLLQDPDLYTLPPGQTLWKERSRRPEGVGILEAPRGTLFHHYRVGENDLITHCNLIVSTTSNNEAMNRAVNWVATHEISGKAEIPESLLNLVETSIRAYDPCLSCATHAVGQMPLEVSLVRENGKLLDRKFKS